MRALERKLLRELWRMRGQMLSIGLVVAAGVMSVMTMRGAYESLARSLDSYYRTHRFADVFASLDRAPEPVVRRIEAIPGVAAVTARIMLVVSLDVPGLEEAAVGQLIALPARPGTELNAVHLVEGRELDPRRSDEVLVSESFANANGLRTGDALGAVINGGWWRLRIAGIAISPDYIGEVAPGTVFPDDRRFAIVRMTPEVLGPAAGMTGAFNEVSVKLARGASEAAVIDALDRVLEPYGGRGAYGRDRHASHEAVMGELEQNRIFGTVLPTILLGVAAFLLAIVLRRLVATQRHEIAVLKAFGYDDRQVGVHYLMFALCAVLLGAMLGAVVGVWLGRGLTVMYAAYFRFPDLAYRVSPTLLGIAGGISLAAAALGALGAVRGAVRLPPAEAMRPEAPARFRPGPLERTGLGARVSAAFLMILRNVERRPARALASVLGVAFAVAVLLIGLVFYDVVEDMIDLQFRRTQREDLAVTFAAVQPASIRHDLASLDGVVAVEPVRMVPVRVSHGHRDRTTVLTGLSPDAALRRVIDADGRHRSVPPHGALLNSYLADILDVRAGDTVRVAVLEGDRREGRLPVAGTVDELFGTAVYMDFDALHEFLGQAPALSGGFLAVDDARLAALNARLKRLPAVAGAYSPAALQATFEELMQENLFVSVSIMILLSSILAVGVIYNGARIALSERGRELASLRVLGFSRREVGVLLLGEQAAVTALGIPLGWLLGWLGAVAVLASFRSERYRFPIAFSASTYLWATLVVLAAATLAALALLRHVNRMDLIAVLKERE